VKQWKDKYLCIDMHEIFFAEFMCLLYEWMKRKTATNSTTWPLEIVAWDQVMLDRLKVLENKWTRAIDF
jgi:hypothetical protein